MSSLFRQMFTETDMIVVFFIHLPNSRCIFPAAVSLTGHSCIYFNFGFIFYLLLFYLFIILHHA